jgi:hypothetical protein
MFAPPPGRVDRDGAMGILEWFGAKPSMQDFAQRLMGRLEREQPGEWQWLQDRAMLVHTSGTQTRLANIYLEYAEAPRSRRAALLDKYASMSLDIGREPPKLWSVAAKNLYVVLRSRYDLDISLIMSRADGAPPRNVVARPLLADLELRLVYDHGQSVSAVPPKLADAWGVSVDALFARGLDNLAALQAPTWDDLGDGLFSLQSEVSYTESFVLVPKVVDRLPFAAHAVLAPCNRGVLLAADGRDEAALVQMVDLAILALQQQPWPMTHVLLERDGAGWKALARDGAVGRKLSEFKRLSEHGLYDEQKAELDRLHERTQEDVFVATASLVRRASDGGVESWCAWTETVETLLPVTDLVALLRDPHNKASKPIFVPWAVVAQTCAAWLESTDESPVRWRTRGFPDEQAWQVLSAAAV